MHVAIHKIKIPTKYLFTLVMLQIIWNPQNQVSMNTSIIIKKEIYAFSFTHDKIYWIDVN